MRREAKRRAVLIGTVVLLCAATARANSVEDIYGMGARAKGTGGAATAIAEGDAAIYYNPARLATCARPRGALGYGHQGITLGVRGDERDPAYEPPGDRDRLDVGVCLPLPADLSFGFHYSQSLQAPMHLRQRSANPTPQYLMYGQRLDQMSIMLGVAYALRDDLALGVAASVLAGSHLVVNNTVPIASDDEVVNEYGWDLSPTAAVYVGAAWQITDALALGATYRSALYHHLHTDSLTEVEVGGMLVSLELSLDSVTWYSPQQAAVGAGFRPLPELLVALDVTWYDWSGYPGPFIHATPDPDSAVARNLRLPEDDDSAYHDIVVPRLGVEYVYDEWLAARVGYGYRPAAVPAPTGSTNVLDTTTHLFGLGAGVVYEGGSAEAPWVLRVDLFGTLSWLPAVLVSKSSAEAWDNYSFGGSVYEAGLGASMEY